ncbi:MAG: glycine-rich protein [Myxococcota bacterium]|nr:glycine-rich protein [Myxococcota bacterium]
MRHLWLGVFLFACSDSEEGLKIYNSEPASTIASHAEGVELLESVEYTFLGLVSADNHSNLDLKVTWSTDVRELCGETSPDADGSTSCRVALETSDTQLKLQVVDPEGAATISSINVNVLETEVPTIELISPTGDGAYYADQLIHFSARINDAEDEPSDLSYRWESSQEGELLLSSPPTSDGIISGYLNLSEGQHAISLRVEDTTGKSNVADLAITVGGPNSEPQCGITSPESGSGFVFGQNVSFAGSGTDVDINNALLSVEWESDVDGVFNTTPPLSNGEIAFTTNQLSIGNHSITLKVEDEVGGLCTAGVQLVVGTPPSLTINSPLFGDTVTLGESVSFTGMVEDQEDIPSDIHISWVSDIDGEFSTQGSDSSGNIAFGYGDLSAGEHNLTITATDSDGLTSLVAQTLRINTPPTIPSLTIAPSAAYSTDALTVSATSEDVDGDAVTLTYEWSGSNGGSYSGSTLPASETSVGEIWTIRVTPNDGYVDGNYAEDSITISNSEPEINGVSISPSTGVYNDVVLTCSATASDADETIAVTYEWMVGADTYTGSSPDLASTSVMPNDGITCSASANDSHGGTASASATVSVENRDPVVSAVGISPAAIYTNSSLSCSATISDDDGETPTSTVDWSVNGSSIGSGDTLQLDSTLISVGDTLVCTVEASDGYSGTGSNQSSGTVLNTDPVIDEITIDLTSPTTADTVVCSANSSDDDGDTPLLSFEWSNQTSGATYTSSTTTSASAQLDLSTISISSNDVLVCSVVSEDTNGGTATASISVVVYNSGPEFDTPASITPGSAVFTETELICSASATDPNDGILTPSYTWSVGGSTVGTGASYTVSASDTDVGDSVVCVSTATDADGEVATSTASVTVENTDPVLSAVSISPSSGVYNDGILSCSALVTDPDESLSASYSWTLNSIGVGIGNSLDLATTSASPPDTVVCTASISDSHGGNDSVAVSATVENRAPSTPVISISPTSPSAGDDLVCQLDTVSVDPDDQGVSYTYEWTKNGTLTSYTTDTVSGSAVGEAETWVCTVTPSDGTVLGSSASASVSTQIPWSGTATFTNCGQDGQTGPSQAQCDSEYAGSSLEGLVVLSGGIQEWVVPTTGTYTIEAIGASGGDNPNASYCKGFGAQIRGDFDLQAGDVLYVLVGQNPEVSYAGNEYGKGGGGGTFVWKNSLPMIIAGGGGGEANESTSCSSYMHGQAYQSGGYHTTSVSNGNGGAVTNCNWAGGGGAGWYSDGSAVSFSFCYAGAGGISPLSGGLGGDSNTCALNSYSGDIYGGFGGGGGSGIHLGGGGGGYTGGEGGGYCNGTQEAGGGGSYNAGYNQSATSGYNDGSGMVLIEFN